MSDHFGFEPAPPAATSSTPPDLSPSPAGTYASPSSLTIDAKGRVTAITAGSGVATYTATVPHGAGMGLPGTTGAGGLIVGWARLKDAGTHAVLNLSSFIVAFHKATSETVALYDAGLAWAHDGSSAVAIQTSSPGYYYELHYRVTPEGTP